MMTPVALTAPRRDGAASASSEARTRAMTAAGEWSMSAEFRREVGALATPFSVLSLAEARCARELISWVSGPTCPEAPNPVISSWRNAACTCRIARSTFSRPRSAASFWPSALEINESTDGIRRNLEARELSAFICPTILNFPALFVKGLLIHKLRLVRPLGGRGALGVPWCLVSREREDRHAEDPPRLAERRFEIRVLNGRPLSGQHE